MIPLVFFKKADFGVQNGRHREALGPLSSLSLGRPCRVSVWMGEHLPLGHSIGPGLSMAESAPKRLPCDSGLPRPEKGSPAGHPQNICG